MTIFGPNTPRRIGAANASHGMVAPWAASRFETLENEFIYFSFQVAAAITEVHLVSSLVGAVPSRPERTNVTQSLVPLGSCRVDSSLSMGTMRRGAVVSENGH